MTRSSRFSDERPQAGEPGPHGDTTVVVRSREGPPADPGVIPDALQRIRAYEVLGPMGGGGMGVVYRARDVERDQIVALKTLSRVSVESFDKVKHEFRAVADIAHENLVTLHELLIEDGVPYFTMELVEGTDFVTHVRGEPLPRKRRILEPLDDARLHHLRDALRQLALGVSALHAAGKLHRDIKPNNVMVTTGGRVVILDFGLALDADAFDDRVVGTPAFMAPEQTAGAPIGTAADWYAVGVMIFLALTGVLPDDAISDEGIDTLDTSIWTRPSQLVTVPSDLDDLCADLLQPTPASRPTGSDVLRRLGEKTPVVAVAASSTLVGRARELEILNRAFGDALVHGTVVVRIEAQSGVGKSALVEHWLEHVAQKRALVLASRCRQRESFSFKAFDGIADAIVEYLTQRPELDPTVWLGPGRDALGRLFPSLRTFFLPGSRTHTTADPQRVRYRGFIALKIVLAKMAAAQPLVIWIDDLQWGDSDSADLLQELLVAPRPVPVLWLVAARSDAHHPGAAMRRAVDGIPEIDRRDMALEPLSDEHCAELARAMLAGSSQTRLEPTDLPAIAREALGNPLLLEQLMRDALTSGAARTDGKVSLRDLVLGRVARLPDDARRMLEAVAMAGSPIPQRVAVEVAAASGDPWAAVALLRVENLVRTHGARGREQIDAWHEGIRETVGDNLAPAARVAYHAALAAALEREAALHPDAVDPAQLATHFHGAGALDQAGSYAFEAARRSSAALAFDRAAKLYALARRCGTGDAVELLRLEADALVNGGRCAEAAPLYLTAAASSSADEALELRRLAAEQLLVSGRVDEGVAQLKPVLEALGLKYPRTPAHALVSVLWQFAKLELRGFDFAPHPNADPRRLRQIDLCWSAGKGLLSFDSIRAAHFLLRMMALSSTSGDAPRASRSLAVVGMLLVFSGDARSYRKGRSMIDRAERVAPADDPHLRGIITICRGTAEMSAGGFTGGMQLLEDGIELLESECSGVRWECSAARSSIFTSLIWIGDIAAIIERAEEYRRNASQVGDLFLEVTAVLYGAVGLLARDRPADARAAADAAIRKWAQDGYHYQHWLAAKIAIWCDLYQGDVDGAVRRCDEAMRRVKRSGLLRVQLMEIDALLLQGRVALAAGSGTSRALANARRLERVGRRLATAGAAHLRAQAALVDGDPARARRLFEDARAGFASAEANMHAAVAAGLAGAAAPAIDAIIADPARWSRIYAETR